MSDIESYKRAYLNTLSRHSLIRLISEALGIGSTQLDCILDEIRRLRENQREDK